MTTSYAGSAGEQPAPSGFAVSERTARLRAETALFMRDHVLSLVSHDLRGPLNAIHSWAYVLERKLDANDANAQRAVTGIRNGVDQQVKLLETIVDATRAETKSLALAYAPFPLHPLIDETVEEVRSGLARARGVEVKVDSQLATEQLNGDRERLAGALWVMLTFAVEASAQGAMAALATRTDATNWHATVTYDTNATALNDPSLPHVLEAFARKQAREPREAKRIAWVLALCKRVAEAHGGSFEQSDATESAAATLALKVPLSAAAAR
ncbi:sensor histidine kinase [Paraburkholderia sp. 22099]|uniref:sensor histidine kinase n=1 Tax=Paraburkholderia TaxID=1822464 RepID=UPI002860F537|nr:HAMP domain-containing sensor histidine kinase [Paraburkholderia terricola]MDR6446899.1 K+-sensing histidine kinase KdpD [Paraburkholderia terricola]MDR6492699.1 K+-sensing histidine kinase KdpD [Paraburkholderia terricola]